MLVGRLSRNQNFKLQCNASIKKTILDTSFETMKKKRKKGIKNGMIYGIIYYNFEVFKKYRYFDTFDEFSWLCVCLKMNVLCFQVSPE